MIRLTELKLPLDHEQGALLDAIAAKLKIPAQQVLSFNLFRRSYDARKKSDIQLIYTVDVVVENPEALLAKFSKDQQVRPTPDMAYKFVASAPDNLTERPLVIGFGPCGLFAGLVLAQMGFKPIIVERGKEVRERTKDTFGFWRKRTLNPESNVQFGEGGAGTF
ncbi:MAG: hypothetical protein ACRDAP_04690, partial [Shewanella sp.]